MKKDEKIEAIKVDSAYQLPYAQKFFEISTIFFLLLVFIAVLPPTLIPH